MKEIMHFSTTKERLKYLSGGFEEIIPVEVAEKGEIEPEEAEKTEEKGFKRQEKIEEG